LQFGVIWYTKPLKQWCKTACFGNSFCFRLHRQNVSRFLFKHKKYEKRRKRRFSPLQRQIGL